MRRAQDRVDGAAGFRAEMLAECKYCRARYDRVMSEVLSVNVGLPRTVEWHGRAVETGIFKAPVDGRVPVRGVNLDGDRQADLRVHGGPDKAVYAYAIEDYEWWTEILGTPIDAATFGENLTTRGLDLNAQVIGDALADRAHAARGLAAATPVLQAGNPHGRRGIRRPVRRRRTVRYLFPHRRRRRRRCG